MRKIILLIVFVFAFIRPVSALDVSIPEAPDAAEEYMPEDTESFGDGVWYLFKLVIGKIHPEIVEASGICLSVVRGDKSLCIGFGSIGFTSPALQFIGNMCFHLAAADTAHRYRAEKNIADQYGDTFHSLAQTNLSESRNEAT